MWIRDLLAFSGALFMTSPHMRILSIWGAGTSYDRKCATWFSFFKQKPGIGCEEDKTVCFRAFHTQLILSLDLEDKISCKYWGSIRKGLSCGFSTSIYFAIFSAAFSRPKFLTKRRLSIVVVGSAGAFSCWLEEIFTRKEGFGGRKRCKWRKEGKQGQPCSAKSHLPIRGFCLKFLRSEWTLLSTSPQESYFDPLVSFPHLYCHLVLRTMHGCRHHNTPRIPVVDASTEVALLQHQRYSDCGYRDY